MRLIFKLGFWVASIAIILLNWVEGNLGILSTILILTLTLMIVKHATRKIERRYTDG